MAKGSLHRPSKKELVQRHLGNDGISLPFGTHPDRNQCVIWINPSGMAIQIHNLCNPACTELWISRSGTLRILNFTLHRDRHESPERGNLITKSSRDFS